MLLYALAVLGRACRIWCSLAWGCLSGLGRAELGMTASRKRVSYVIPPSAARVPRLKLPALPITRLGQSAPLLIPDDDAPDDPPDSEHGPSRHPRHRLPVASLTLDSCTILEGRHAPEGILYSGGRDGLVLSWDLGLPMKKRALENGRSPFKRGTWEVMTGWADELEDEDADGSDRATSDGDVLGDVPLSAHLRRRHMLSELNIVPYEQRWETDLSSFHPGTVSRFPVYSLHTSNAHCSEKFVSSMRPNSRRLGERPHPM